jgi:hypothetical protein
MSLPENSKVKKDKGKYETIPLIIVGFAAAMVMVAVFIHMSGGTVTF